MGTPQSATTAAPAEPVVYRLTIQVVSKSPEGVARVQQAAVKAFGADLITSECFVVRDDAHPAAKK